MRPRIADELELLRETFGQVDHVEVGGCDWFRIRQYAFPSGWAKDGKPIDQLELLLNANAGYPTADPYAFWTPVEISFNGQPPNNTTEVDNAAFEGKWLQFSWAPDGTWQPGSTVRSGSNLTDWARSFEKRLAKGV